MYRNQHQNRNNMYFRGSNTPRYQVRKQAPKTSFEESSDAAFFLGKLNKHLDRETIYRALTAEARREGFYVRKLDMPYGNSTYKSGNKGYAFVHCRSKEEACRMIRKGQIKLNNQYCEIKPYGGRMDDSSSTQGGMDSGVNSGFATPRKFGSWSKQVSQEEIERTYKKLEDVKINRQRTQTISSNSISENEELYYSHDQNTTNQSIDEFQSEVQIQPDIPEEETTGASGYISPLQDSTNYSSVFTYENVLPFVYKNQQDALKKGMSTEQFAYAYAGFYEDALHKLQQADAEQILDLQFGLSKELILPAQSQQICN